MPETDYLQEFKSFFLPGDPNDPRVNPDLRKRIALAMMARQRKAPQNIGEGLNAIGEAIGDVRAQRRLEEQDIAQTEKLKGLTAAVEGAGVAPAVSVPTGTGAVSGAALAPPVAGESTEPFVPPPPPPVTRSAGVPSPLPPDTAGAMPQPAPPQMITSLGTNTIAPPSGALPGSPREMDPRARAALLLAARQRGITPPNPPPAGAQTPAPMPPLAPPIGGPSPVPMSQGPGGNPLDANAQMSALPPTTAGQNIRPAPPPPRLARPEPPGEPAPPGMVPLTPVQQRAIKTAREHPQDADVQRVMKDLYDREEVKRTFQQGILNKQYELRLKQADPQYQATLEKTRQEVAKGNVPALVEDVEKKYERNPVTGAYEPARIAGVDSSQRPTLGGASEFQGKALVNYGRARLAHETLTPAAEQILASSGGQALLGRVGASALQNTRYKEADIARENFVQAFIRQQSGGAYTVPELEKEARSMLPAVGDPPTLLEQKRAQREQFIGGLSGIIGPRGVRAAEFDMGKERTQTATAPGRFKEGDTASDASGNKIIYRGGQWSALR